MNHIKPLLFASVLLLFSPTHAPAAQEFADIEGEEWVSTITSQSSSCKSIETNIVTTHNFVVLVKKDDKRVVLHRASGISYYGTVDKENPQLIHYWASYLKEAGVLTERIKFEKSDNNSGMGKSIWNWSDEILSCGGEYSFTAVLLTKQ